jgi:hypothetical protein
MVRSAGSLAIVLAACSYAAPPDVPAPQLFAIHPSLANTGDAITLEGTFSETTMVNFPGGAVEQPTILGSHRARVIVPAGAETGGLTVTTGSVTTPPVTFRRGTFRDVGAFHRNGSCIDESVVSLAARRAFAAAVQEKGSVHVLGGGSAIALNSVERATINPLGSLDMFTTLSGSALITARHSHAVATIGEWLYVLGGYKNDGVIGYSVLTVERAHIDDDGSLGPFEMQQGPLVYGRLSHSVEVIGNRLYVLGGGPSQVELSEIDDRGDLGRFTLASDINVLPGFTDNMERFGSASVVVGDSLYLVGGGLFDTDTQQPAGALAIVHRASISGDGTLGPFTLASSVLVSARSYASYAVIGKSLCVFGGFESNTTECASGDNISSLERFEQRSDATLSTRLAGAAVAFAGTRVYLLGGYDSQHLDTVECAAIQLDE